MRVVLRTVVSWSLTFNRLEAVPADRYALSSPKERGPNFDSVN